MGMTKITLSFAALMKLTSNLIQLIKQFGFILVLLFALAPCTTKELLYQHVDLDYQRTLNKTKIGQAMVDDCDLHWDFDIKAVKAQNAKVFLNVPLVCSAVDSVCPICTNDQIAHSDLEQSSQTLPLYILYKRMKIRMT